MNAEGDQFDALYLCIQMTYQACRKVLKDEGAFYFNLEKLEGGYSLPIREGLHSETHSTSFEKSNLPGYLLYVPELWG